MRFHDLRALSAGVLAKEQKRIKLVVSDIDGCLNRDVRTYNHDALAWIRLANELARHDNVIPFVTVCSGRQHSYVEAIVRMISGEMPAIFEGGCGLFFPNRTLYDEYEWHPSLSQPDVSAEFAEVRDLLTGICMQTGARRVIGKEVLFSLHPAPSMSVAKLHLLIDKALAREDKAATVCNSGSALDVTPSGIDKGSGLRWLVSSLSQEFLLDLSNIAGIGDSAGDLTFLRMVGLPAAPANAADQVKRAVAYCSPLTDGEGVVDIIMHCIRINSQ